MSESVRALLVRGVAAAKTGRANDKEEARFYLEWVLRSHDATSAQKASAWLWLSQIEDEPTKKRDCLENVLAWDPANIPARRGLAILEGRLKPEDIVDPNKPIEPVKPDAIPQPAAVRRYVCPKCGGPLARVGVGDQGSLICDYCGNRLQEDQALQQGALVDEEDFTVALATAKGHRWELPLERTLRCEGCGATFTLPPLHVSGSCPFCGSAHVITSSSGELIEPEGVLLFQFDAAGASQRIRLWLDNLKFRPGDLDERAGISQPRKVFLPFWTFDLGGMMSWNAQVEEGYGRNKVWAPRNGIYLVYHDDLLVPGTRAVPKDVLDDLAEYDTQSLVPYSAGLLSDTAAEIYQVPLADASLVARQQALRLGQAYVHSNDLAGETYRDFFMSSSGLIVESYKLVLLPLWIADYRYKNETFLAAVNGQSGKAAGRVPRSGLQKTLASLFGQD
jgi:Zn finger protein HypA/HybF involved in hydrogenase expression